jgi:copper homeostasis protein
MKDYVLECCVDSVESALAAEKGGANRLELCGSLIIGGTTPGINLFLAVRERVSLKIYVLIRPRFGDFCYTDEEFMIMLRDIALFKKHGADGIVVGALNPDGSLDCGKMKELIAAAGGMRVTLHRAFDVCRNPLQALREAKALGVNTILTSGQKNSCVDGIECIRQLVETAHGFPDILIGGGVNHSVIKELVDGTKAKSFHMSGKVNVESKMTYRKDDVSMGLPLMSEYTIFRTDAHEVEKVREILRGC